MQKIVVPKVQNQLSASQIQISINKSLIKYRSTTVLKSRAQRILIQIFKLFRPKDTFSAHGTSNFELPNSETRQHNVTLVTGTDVTGTQNINYC